jgi:hypothetical protein
MEGKKFNALLKAVLEVQESTTGFRASLHGLVAPFFSSIVSTSYFPLFSHPLVTRFPSSPLLFPLFPLSPRSPGCYSGIANILCNRPSLPAQCQRHLRKMKWLLLSSCRPGHILTNPSFNLKGVEGPQPEVVQGALCQPQPRLMTKPAPSRLYWQQPKKIFTPRQASCNQISIEPFLRLLRSVFCPLQYYPVLGLVQVWYCNPSFLNQPRMLDPEPISMDEW